MNLHWNEGAKISEHYVGTYIGEQPPPQRRRTKYGVCCPPSLLSSLCCSTRKKRGARERNSERGFEQRERDRWKFLWPHPPIVSHSQTCGNRHQVWNTSEKVKKKKIVEKKLFYILFISANVKKSVKVNRTEKGPRLNPTNRQI